MRNGKTNQAGIGDRSAVLITALTPSDQASPPLGSIVITAPTLDTKRLAVPCLLLDAP